MRKIIIILAMMFCCVVARGQDDNDWYFKSLEDDTITEVYVLDTKHLNKEEIKNKCHEYFNSKAFDKDSLIIIKNKKTQNDTIKIDYCHIIDNESWFFKNYYIIGPEKKLKIFNNK